MNKVKGINRNNKTVGGSIDHPKYEKIKNRNLGVVFTSTHGITLITLVITIIILIILAGVTINLTIGEKGIMTQAQKAKIETRGAEVEEIIELWKGDYYISKHNTKNEEELLNELLNSQKVFEKEINRENKIITIGFRKIDYNIKENNSIVNKINIGWTLGNTLDVYKESSTMTVEEFETYWGNPTTTKEMIKAIKDLGFDTILIPVTWYNHVDENNIVNEEWMNRIKEVVDYAMSNNLITIINMHHDDKKIELSSTDIEFQNVIDKYTTIWNQIAEVFKNYNENLIFEIINEPRVIEDGNDIWNPEEIAYTNLNTFNNKMVETIRKTGGNNSTRCLLIPTYGTLTNSTSLNKISLPKDNNIALSVHGYITHEYCSDTTIEYNEEIENSIISKFDKLKEFSEKNNIPVLVTEFGCYPKSDRNTWIKMFSLNAGNKNIGIIWWDNGKQDEYQIFDRINLSILDIDAFNTMKKIYKNARYIEKTKNIVNEINTINADKVSMKTDINMGIKVENGVNHYYINDDLLNSARFKFSDVYIIDQDYDFYEFSCKIKTKMSELKLQLVINFLDENDQVIYKVNYDNIARKNIDGTKEIYEINKLYSVTGAKKVQIERLSAEPVNSDTTEHIEFELYDISLKGI